MSPGDKYHNKNASNSVSAGGPPHPTREFIALPYLLDKFGDGIAGKERKVQKGRAGKNGGIVKEYRKWQLKKGERGA